MSVFNRDSDDEVARGAPALVVRAEVPGPTMRDTEARLEEAEGLALAIGIDVRWRGSFRFKRAAQLLGRGFDAIAFRNRRDVRCRTRRERGRMRRERPTGSVR